MHIYQFSGQGSIIGYSADLTGANLPEHMGPWSMTRALDMVPGETERPSVDTETCLRDIETIGYHLTERGQRITADQELVPTSAPVRRTSA